MICKDIPQVLYCHIGGSGTWGCEFPEDIHFEGLTVLQTGMEFETPYGTTVPMKLYELDASVTADGKPRRVLFCPFHGWANESPMYDTPSERLFWVLQRAGVKYILTDGSGGGINPLMEPGDMIAPTDFIDLTKRISYLEQFNKNVVRMRNIVCKDLHDILVEEAKKEFPRVFRTGVMAVMEGPRFESPAEIRMLYDMHCDICGQTMMPEAALARAIGALYASIYLVSNYAEGINPDWEKEIHEIYEDTATTTGKVMIRAMAAIDPSKITEKAEDYWIRTNIGEHNTGKE
ncbi:MAG: MTAP family purine nucleoside phosphorylase [Oscillospiraceae bacterium]|nr:MTAP family purine nucleoside phosphorylase [Oscillospiraceae bacterium]